MGAWYDEKKEGCHVHNVKRTLKPLLLILLGLALAAALFVGAVFGWAWYRDAKDERITREVIAPKAAAYLAEQYPGNDFEVQSPFYVFKDNAYRVKVRSRSSEDTYFYLDYHYKSYELVRDSYESQVLEGRNTLDRLVNAYRELARGQLEPMEGLTYANVGYCSYSENTGINLHFSPDGLDRETLILDEPYDAAAMGAQYGYLELTFLEDEEQIGLERAYERMAEADRLLTEAGIGWYVMEVELQNGEYPNDTVTFYLYGVRKEDLTADAPIAHLQEMWDAQEANRRRIKAEREQNS